MGRMPDSLTEVLEDEALAEHIARHGVSVTEVRQVVANGFKVSINIKDTLSVNMV